MGKIDNNLSLLLAFAPASSHDGKNESSVTEGTNAGVILALVALLQGTGASMPFVAVTPQQYRKAEKSSL